MSPSSPLVLIVPGRIETRSGGYEYDRRMVAGLGARGWSVEVHELDGSFPRPTRSALDDAARAFASIPDGTTVLVDGLALGAMPNEVERERGRLRVVALIHSLIADEVGLDRVTAGRFAAAERRALNAAAMAVVTGRSTAAALAGYGLAPSQIVVVEPGTDRAALARGSGIDHPAGRGPGVLQLLCVATLNRGKGYDLLIRALSMVPGRGWHLTCAGSLDRNPGTAARVRDLIRSHGLEDRVSLVGELTGAALEACWNRADVFVLATLSETYGMAVAEALAHGLPVISTTTGAIPDLVGSSAGILVPPGDTAQLSHALSCIVNDRAVRHRLAEGARRVRERLPTWDDAFDKMSLALERHTS